jgi:hypothetical protein
MSSLAIAAVELCTAIATTAWISRLIFFKQQIFKQLMARRRRSELGGAPAEQAHPVRLHALRPQRATDGVRGQLADRGANARQRKAAGPHVEAEGRRDGLRGLRGGRGRGARPAIYAMPTVAAASWRRAMVGGGWGRLAPGGRRRTCTV